MKISIFWYRRDLRFEDNTALNNAINSGLPVMPIFIFDPTILKKLPKNDPRVTFIHKTLWSLNEELKKQDRGLNVLYGDVEDVWKKLINEYTIEKVFINKDYEPYSLARDNKIEKILSENGVHFQKSKDQVIFEENEIVKNDGNPYTVYTPYKNKWLGNFDPKSIKSFPKPDYSKFHKSNFKFPSLADIGFIASPLKVKSYKLESLENYAETRNFPAKESTSNLGPHLRFGTISIRQVIDQLHTGTEVFLNELIWREFFMQILYRFPHVVNQNFKTKYNRIEWRNNKDEFEQWCEGKTGYPLVDAGMRQLNSTGYMHNRVRMITAGFLCKHLLIDWRWGEAYFAEKLLDYELASNNGNWQWAAGTGCDAAPYFRIFNPVEQLNKFDKNFEYVKKWLPEYKDSKYIEPIVDHKQARQRALDAYRSGMQKLNF